jgi:hypothetical protein
LLLQLQCVSWQVMELLCYSSAVDAALAILAAMQCRHLQQRLFLHLLLQLLRLAIQMCQMHSSLKVQRLCGY